MKKLALLAVIFMLAGTLAQAGVTVNVSKAYSDAAHGQDATHTDTITKALELCSGDGDTILIQDSSVYSEDFYTPINRKADNTTLLTNLTIQADAGTTPTLERPASSAAAAPVVRFGPINNNTTQLLTAHSSTYTIRGADANHKMTLRQLKGNIAQINSGTNFRAMHDIVCENLILERPVPGTGQSYVVDGTSTLNPGVTTGYFSDSGPFIKVNHSGTITCTNIDFVGRNKNDFDDMIHVAMSAGAQSTFTNVDFSQANGNDVPMDYDGLSSTKINAMVGLNSTSNQNFTSAYMTFNHCNFALSNASKALGNRMAIFRDNGIATGGKVEFNDCTFDTGGSVAVPGPAGLAFGSPQDVTITTPHFVGPMGTAAIRLDLTDRSATAAGYTTLKISGTKGGDKADLSPLTPGGFNVISMMQGTVTLTDCASSSATAVQHNVVLTTNTTQAPLGITMDRCIWGDNAGMTFASTGGDATKKSTVNASNTIWLGATGNAGIVNSVSTDNTSVTLNLTHCTLTGAGNALLALGSQDKVTGNYSIFDASLTTTKKANATYTLNGTGNLCWAGTAGTAVFATEPAGTLHGDPKLDVTGHIALDSPARDAANGSSATIWDVDGQHRPVDGKTCDIGADEIAVNPATSWSVFE